MKADKRFPEDRSFPLPTNPPHPEKRHHQWQFALLIFFAMAVFLADIHADRKVRIRKTPELTVEAMIASTGENDTGVIDPQRAIFEFKPIDINMADPATLSSLKGIGPAIADRIVVYRQEKGCFSDPEELLEVKGVGSSKLARIRSELVATACPD